MPNFCPFATLPVFCLALSKAPGCCDSQGHSYLPCPNPEKLVCFFLKIMQWVSTINHRTQVVFPWSDCYLRKTTITRGKNYLGPGVHCTNTLFYFEFHFYLRFFLLLYCPSLHPIGWIQFYELHPFCGNDQLRSAVFNHITFAYLIHLYR